MRKLPKVKRNIFLSNIISWLNDKKNFLSSLISKNTDPSETFTKDILSQFGNQDKQSTKVLVFVALAGLVIFMMIAFIAPFRDRLFTFLFPKPKSQAALCSGSSKVPAEKEGFVYTGGDLTQEIKDLNTPLYYTYDTSLGPNKAVYLIGKYTHHPENPLGMQILMDDNLSNPEFKGLDGQVPAGWNLSTSGRSGTAVVERWESVSGTTSVKITNLQSPSGTQISQAFKKEVKAGQYVIFGTWVKTADPASIKVFLQNDQTPFEEFGVLTTPIEPNGWTYALGYGKVPDKVTSFRLVLRVTSQNSTAWFDNAAAAIVGGEISQILAKMVAGRCGSAWFIDDEPGWQQTYSVPYTKPLAVDLYSLIYSKFYSDIKSVDPSAIVMPGGVLGAPNLFDNTNSYSPKSFLDSFRQSYKNLFGSEPSVDAMNIHYLADKETNWSDAKDLSSYLGKLRDYMDQIPDWKGKPIWIGKLGVSKNAPSAGAEFAAAALDFLKNNKLSVEKWFWFDSCGNIPQLASLFESNNKICTWPMKLTQIGDLYSKQNLLPTPTPSAGTTSTPTPSPTNEATSSSTLVPSPISTESTSSATNSGGSE